MSTHKPFRDKMKVMTTLSHDPNIKNHLPETKWFRQDNLVKMLDKYKAAYIKPNKGKQGRSIVRVKNTKDGHEISSGSDRINIPSESLKSELKKTMSDSIKYVVQQGIDLATYKGRPFDMRIVAQKPYNFWQISLTGAKVATFKEAAVTNLTKGSKAYALQEILCNYDQRQDPMATLREIIDLSHQISYILGEHFPLRIIGLDIAVDKKGKLWFIEANTQPINSIIKVNDVESQKKYLNAKQIIKDSL
ncbi:YheC/YheD family protein [Proteinivorax hydrogeniformans]|uniref:YheC/YheD family protein n=1 Tax=Proteinivorax hydrogeniformans TaxID=1826727 RepID=A0AAU8HV30_9FIRM